MITNSRQKWEVGEVVNVGFLKLRVTAKIPTPGDGFPDIYELESPKTGVKYEFQPHYGLTRKN